jgi:hypothetical protein
MSLQLYVEAVGASRPELTRPRTTIESLLTDDHGRIVCNFSGMPAEGQTDRTWVLMSGGTQAAFWNWSCLHMPLEHTESYTLTIRVKDVDGNTPAIRLLPTIESDHAVWP